MAQLLMRGWKVYALTLEFNKPLMAERERAARGRLLPILRGLGPPIETIVADARWLWHFRNGDEIPRRNKLILDWMIANQAIPRGITDLAMGEYVGADTWLVRDHVGASDCDARFLEAYLLHEYGLDYRLITLRDFGESRYKHHRLHLLIEAIGTSGAMLTTNCLHDVSHHCGRCYKCIERHAAFVMLGLTDETDYASPPGVEPALGKYLRQMDDERAVASVSEFAL